MRFYKTQNRDWFDRRFCSITCAQLLHMHVSMLSTLYCSSSHFARSLRNYNFLILNSLAIKEIISRESDVWEFSRFNWSKKVKGLRKCASLLLQWTEPLYYRFQVIGLTKNQREKSSGNTSGQDSKTVLQIAKLSMTVSSRYWFYSGSP